MRIALLAAPIALVAGLVVATPAAAEPEALEIGSGELTVTVAPQFPQVIAYRHAATGETLHGGSGSLNTVLLNGTAHTPTVTSTPAPDRVRYTLRFPDAAGVELDASLSVAGHTVRFRIDAVRDSDAFRVHTIDIPNHDLVSARSTDPAAQVAAARIDLSTQRNGDTIFPVTQQTPADAAPIGSTYALVSTGRIAAALETNSVHDKPAGATANDNAHFWRQARRSADHTEVGVWSGQWTYRADGARADDTEPLPEVTVAVTGERNGDYAMDWQDGALALREIAYLPAGAEETRDRVVQRIPFNIASMATHPFLSTLDETKRISLATDGLGQFVLLKGYQSEGHDAAHPDYGGNYNTRAGGLADLNTLLERGKRYNADFGVHVNATESYPEAHAFSETLVDKNNPQWAWMDQSYRINQRRDLTSGDVQARFRRLRDETGGKLDFLYIDVFRETGWTADRLARELRGMGFQISTEWSHRFVRDALWTHWSADFDYGGIDLKGINSTILRFLGNHQRDVFIPHPLLGSAQIVEFEGWTGEVDYNAFLHNVFGTNLPTKYLQHFPITRWGQTEIVLEGGVRVSGTSVADRLIFAGDAKVLDGDAYLLPWQPTDPTKLYHYNADGGRTTWRLPSAFAGHRSLQLYRLTDTGRTHLGTVPVVDGQVSLDAAARTGYVLYPEAPGATADPNYGEGTPVRDPGFTSGTLAAWQVEGDRRSVGVQQNTRGQHEAVVAGRGPVTLRQQLRGLRPGSYSASATVEVQPGAVRPTELTVRPERGRPRTTWLDRSTLPNTTASDEKHGTNAQRVRVFFDVPHGSSTATLMIRVAPGTGAVRLDDIRVVPMRPPTAQGRVTSWDFEDVDAGWGPFLRGADAAVSDANTHLAELHAPYTQRGWNGKAIDDVINGRWSLKSFEYAAQLAYRTVPHTVRFQPGHRYRVTFDYESAAADAYGWVLGVDGPAGTRELATTALPARTIPTAHTQEFVAGSCGDYWVGLRRLTARNDEQLELSLDNFTVTDLGRASTSDPCGAMEIATATQKLLPGQPNTVTTTFRNGEPRAVADVGLALTVPDGWTATPAGPTGFASVPSGGPVSTQWTVSPPADTPVADYDLVATASYRAHHAGARTVTGSLAVQTVPPPPTEDAWASDLGWMSADNGWGPVERDQSNGEIGAGDGRPLTVGGQVYPKGLGAHAPSRVTYFLAGNCTRFTAEVGVDDSQDTRGSVRFQVLADGRVVAETPVLRNDAAPHAVDADLTGAREVTLVALDGGDGIGNDHADWAAARFRC